MNLFFSIFTCMYVYIYIYACMYVQSVCARIILWSFLLSQSEAAHRHVYYWEIFPVLIWCFLPDFLLNHLVCHLMRFGEFPRDIRFVNRIGLQYERCFLLSTFFNWLHRHGYKWSCIRKLTKSICKSLAFLHHSEN